ncbi:MAG: FmdB family zinc ribbon protein [Anaeromyxobacter sp.]
MPIYEYDCPQCGRFDVLQKMSSPALETHDVCGSKVTKAVSAGSFALKGSGFYLTDYGGRNANAITGKADKAEAKSDGGGCAPGGCGACPAASA